MDLIVRRARLRGFDGLKDIGVEDGRVVQVEDRINASAAKEIYADGRLTTSALVNSHVHLDKCLTAAWKGATLASTNEAIAYASQIKKKFTVEDIKQRAGSCIRMAAVHGTTVMRGFADVDAIGGLTAVKALLEVKKEYGRLMDLQVVAFPQEGIVRDEGSEELLWKAMELGADVIGGIPWYELTDEDAKKHVDVVFDVAKKFDADVHMLIDNTDDPNSRTLEYYAAKTIREGYQGRVSASHAEALAAYNDYHAQRVIDLVKKASMSIITNPHISLVLAGRSDKQPIRRGITRVKELLRSGVNVACGQDDVNDPYYPFGRADMLEVGLFASHVAQLTSPQEIEVVYDMVSLNGAKALGIRDYGLEVGKRADLIVLDAPDVHEAFRLQADRLYVVKKGEVVAESRSKDYNKNLVTI